MALFDLQFEGLDELDRQWNVRVRDRIVIVCQVAVLRAALSGAALARQLVPVGARYEGEFRPHLRDKIFATIVGSTIDPENGNAFKSVRADILADAKYASYVENGTRPHIIPVRKGFLAWENPAAQGDWVFARHDVHHPGTKPHPYMGPAYQQAERELERQVTAGVETICADFNRD